MSPLWRNEVGVYVTPRRIYLVRIKRGMRPVLEREEDHVVAEATGGWEGALNLYESLLATGGWSDAAARIVLGDHWVRYTIVPWSDALSGPAERLAHARELLSSVFGESMSDWTITLSSSPPGVSCLASAVPTALLTALKDLTLRHGQKLITVQPQLIAAFNTWRHALPVAASAWFVTLEEGSLAALRMCSQGIDRVHAVRIGADWARELKRLQTFGRLASSSLADGRVYVDLPVALRAMRPEITADLEWLDEPNPPLTTLHQLEFLRRKAA
ncbi:MAG: hypothetical protein M3O26_03565 [Pseudomonadota bacterium]|nr:hypothetical protein [Pseudomonadota bacterium]